MEKMITQRYMEMYNGRNQAVGVFVGLIDKGLIRTGWSRCHIHKGDKFDMSRGIAYAIQNMVFGKEIPFMANIEKYEAFANEYDNFRDRCRRYFKDHRMEGDTDGNVASAFLNDTYKMMFGGQKDLARFIESGLPLAQELYRQGVVGIGIPVGVGDIAGMGMNDLMGMLKFVGMDGAVMKPVPPAPAPAPAPAPSATKLFTPMTDPTVKQEVTPAPAPEPTPKPYNLCDGCTAADCSSRVK